jgi:hypothetical protein
MAARGEILMALDTRRRRRRALRHTRDQYDLKESEAQLM